MKLTFPLAALGAALALATPDAHAASKPQATVDPAIALAKAKAAIAWQMKDPDSVKWRRVKVSSNGNVCIEVNGKNSYGAYEGFELYFYQYRTGDIASNQGWMSGMWCNNGVTMPKNSILMNTFETTRKRAKVAP